MTEEKLLQMKSDLESAKTRKSELKGQETALLKQLKDEYGCTSIEDAEEKLEELEKEVSDLEKKIKKGCDELEETYEL